VAPEGAQGRPSRSRSQGRKRPEAGSRPPGPGPLLRFRSKVSGDTTGNRAASAVPCPPGHPPVPAGQLAGSPRHRHPPWKGDGSWGAAAGPGVGDAGLKPPAEHGAEQTAPPHILPPAPGRGSRQPGPAGLRQQAHQEVHRGRQGDGEGSGEGNSPLPPQTGTGTAPPVSPWHLPAPLGPVPGPACPQLPRGAALGGLQCPAVEIPIGERGWGGGGGQRWHWGCPWGWRKLAQTPGEPNETPAGKPGSRGVNGVWGGRPAQCPLPQNESKRREILCDLALLVGAAAGARGQLRQECGATQLGQLYQQANAFLLLLQTFQWEAGPWEPGCPPRSVEQTDITSIFGVYRRLVQGKLRFFFHSLTKDSC
uniref:TPO protein n=1 Tax=Calidris pygmaea TaxID=425635 RepID=A0A8C3JQM5_9CHAR